MPSKNKNLQKPGRAANSRPKAKKGSNLVNIQRRERVPIKGHDVFGGGNIVSNTSTVPSAFCITQGNVTFVSQPRGVRHPQLGINGIQLTGCQPFIDLDIVNATTGLFTTGTLATSGANGVQMNPDAFNGPLAAQANLHQKYVFRDLLFEVNTNCASTYEGSIALAIVEDGAGINVPTSFSTTRQINPSVSFAARTERTFLHYHYDGPELFYTELENATLAGSRLSCQGQIVGWPNSNALTTKLAAYVNVWYVIELYQSTLTQGFTFFVPAKTKEERDFLRAKQIEYENSPPLIQNWSVVSRPNIPARH